MMNRLPAILVAIILACITVTVLVLRHHLSKDGLILAMIDEEIDNPFGGITLNLMKKQTDPIPFEGIRAKKLQKPMSSILSIAPISSIPSVKSAIPNTPIKQSTPQKPNFSLNYRPDLSNLTDALTNDAFSALVNHYLAPWRGLSSQGVPAVRITQRMLATMEFAYKGGGFRVRIVNNKLYFRKLVHWKQTYRTQRMLWYLRFLYEIFRKDHLLSDKTMKRGLDFVIYVGDGAKVAADTFTTEAGFPLFSLRTSALHVDIPIPDPVQHGSNGNYQWSSEGKLVPWEEKKSKLVFRGRGSCLKMQADNWHFCNRVRLQQLSMAHPEIIDAGIIQWNQIYKANNMVCPPATIDEIEHSTGLKTVPPLDFEAQSHYKFILDVDGGLGSSRKPGILSSGSVLFAAESPWYTYYEPLLRPWHHYIPIDRWFRDLPSTIKWAQDNDANAKAIMEQGREFEAKYLTISASKQYMATLLNAYAELLLEMVPGDEPIKVDYCTAMKSKEVAEGPMGCSCGWILYNDHDIPDEIISDGKFH